MGHTKNVREIVEQLKIADEQQFAQLAAEYAGDPRAGLAKALAAARHRLDKQREERLRVEKMYQIMHEAGDDKVVVGIDEVGRGSLAGPLTVAAVVLPNQPLILGLNDSKKLSPKQREELAATIRQRARAIGIAHVQPAQIDERGMAVSLRQAMASALDNLGIDADLVLIDGNPVHVHPREQCIVKGDSKVACIAAASIVAKVTRDRMMVEYAEVYPGYAFERNKGYGTKAHYEGLRAMGPCPIHRKTFLKSMH